MAELRVKDVAGLRLGIQRLIGTPFVTAQKVVACLGAVQAQDYAGAKWGLAQRTRAGTDSSLDETFDGGEILRTHVMRVTWHFVTPEDIRWLLALTGPRVQAVSAWFYRKLELDAATLRRSRGVISRALRGHRYRTRTELGAALRDAGIAATGLRLNYIAIHGETQGLICSGPRRGRQFTYALLDERVPAAASRTRDWALAELTRRYFSAHGPAVLRDFVWWSGLTVADARAGLEMTAGQLTCEMVNGHTWWFSEGAVAAAKRIRVDRPTVRLLPNYDESVMYQERSPHPKVPSDRAFLDRVLGAHILTIDGQIAGGWRRDIEKRGVRLYVTPLRSLSRDEREAIGVQGERFGRFLGAPVTLSIAAVARH